MIMRCERVQRWLRCDAAQRPSLEPALAEHHRWLRCERSEPRNQPGRTDLHTSVINTGLKLLSTAVRAGQVLSPVAARIEHMFEGMGGLADLLAAAGPDQD